MSMLGFQEANCMKLIQHRQYKRKSIYNVYKKRFQPLRHNRLPTIPSKLPFFPSTTSTWEGDEMNKNPSRGHIRFWVQNCNGLKIRDEANVHHNFTQLLEYGVNYSSFTETNLNTNNPQATSKLHRIFRSRYTTGKMSITNSPEYPTTSLFQPGGVFSGFDQILLTRYMSLQRDPLGRWHCHTFRGKERDIKIYTIYRVHRKSDDNTGLTTAWMQQRDLLRKKKYLSKSTRCNNE